MLSETNRAVEFNGNVRVIDGRMYVFRGEWVDAGEPSADLKARVAGVLFEMALSAEDNDNPERAAEYRAEAAKYGPIAFAAIGDDGRRPVVWGVGDTEREAREDAAESLRDAECNDDSADLRVVVITAERRAKIEDGDVDAEGL